MPRVQGGTGTVSYREKGGNHFRGFDTVNDLDTAHRVVQVADHYVRKRKG